MFGGLGIFASVRKMELASRRRFGAQGSRDLRRCLDDRWLDEAFREPNANHPSTRFDSNLTIG